MPTQAKWGISLLVAFALISIGWKYSFVLVTLHVMVCFVLVIVIMLQSGSAADLAGAFGGAGSQTAFGPRGAATFLSRATTWCAIVFMLTSLALSVKRARPPARALAPCWRRRIRRQSRALPHRRRRSRRCSSLRRLLHLRLRPRRRQRSSEWTAKLRVRLTRNSQAGGIFVLSWEHGSCVFKPARTRRI